jgi:hypothetical protein
MRQHRVAESKLRIATWSAALLLTIVGGAAIGSSFQRPSQPTTAAAGPTPLPRNGAPVPSGAPPTVATTTTSSIPLVPPPATALPSVIPGDQGTTGVRSKGYAGRSHHDHRAKDRDE